MPRNTKLLNQRSAYVKQVVNDARKEGVKVSFTVNQLSKQLFVSERAIYKDLSK